MSLGTATLMHRAFVVPPDRKAGPDLASSARCPDTPSREGVVRLDFHSADGKGGVPWGDLFWGKEAPPSRCRLLPHWPRPSHTASPGRSLGMTVVGHLSPLEGKELGSGCRMADRESWWGGRPSQHGAERARQGRAVDRTTSLSPRSAGKGCSQVGPKRRCSPGREGS